MNEILEKVVKSKNWYCSTVLVTVVLLFLHSRSALAVPHDQSARNVFNSTCASCHGQSGIPTAVGKSLNAPDLGSGAVQKQTTAQLQQIISEGKGNMPPFKSSLSEAQIHSLIAYIRTLSKKKDEPISRAPDGVGNGYCESRNTRIGKREVLGTTFAVVFGCTLVVV